MYLLLGLEYSGKSAALGGPETALRIPKILMMLDDMSGTSLFTNSVENEFYKFVVQRRHLHVFAMFRVAHSITNLFYQFRVN